MTSHSDHGYWYESGVKLGHQIGFRRGLIVGMAIGISLMAIIGS